MKKTALLNSEISYLIADLGHQDTIVIADCGLPVPIGVKKIDLALVKGVPSFIETLNSVLCELCIEQVTVADELAINEAFYRNINNLIDTIPIHNVSHAEFKELVKNAKAVIRTGEQTPYANIILKSGVIF